MHARRRHRELDALAPEVQSHIQLSFVALRELEEALVALRKAEEERNDKIDRDGILYHVGQVKQHHKFGYRGVIIGWDRRPVTDVSNCCVEC